MSPDPLDYLRHILDEADYLIKRSQGLTKEDLLPSTGFQSLMRYKPPIYKRLQGAADARRRARRRTIVLQVPDNKADAAPCERYEDFDRDDPLKGFRT